MRLGCHSWIWFFITLISFSSSAAVVQGQYTSANITNTVNTVVKKKLIERGFSSNDPRYSTTLSSVASKTNQIAKASKSVSVAGLTGRTWLTASIRSALFGRGALIALAATGVIQWRLEGEDNIKVSVYDTSREVARAGYYWSIGASDYLTLNDGATSICSGYQYCHHFVVQSYYSDPSRDDLRTVRFYTDAAGKNEWTSMTGRHRTCSSSMVSLASCQLGYVPKVAIKIENLPLQEAVSTLTENDFKQPLNPQIVADIANNVWSLASQGAGYAGVPYSPSYEATVSDVNAASSTKPSVGDLVVPDGQFGNDTSTNLGIDPNPVIGGDSSVIGTDPVIGSPSVDSPYTAKQVIAPIEDSMPFLRNLELPVKSATCPTYSFEFNGKNFVADVHCDLIEQYKTLIQLISSICWSLVALRMILSA
ncbi:hypothetical protein KKJ06_08150 [Xenorhabdus bovienii]|uniref:hypothetical protein n=1 Tax=Xenorhabdus bovienii TaxID=40576 RepID=UPI0023B208D7|nr:hypothetical protein [Xenorhabdus bovienii]MDE9555409.1 hypothetical protein [Xenorhabdus bovienii]